MFNNFNSGVNHFINNHYSVHRSNSANPRVVLLPERHTNKTHRIKNGYLINAGYRPGDVVLVEDRSDKKIKSYHGANLGQTRFVAKKIATRGWDHEETKLESDTLNKKGTETFCAIFDVFRTSPKSKEFKEKVQNFRRLCKKRGIPEKLLVDDLPLNLQDKPRSKNVREIRADSLFGIYTLSRLLMHQYLQEMKAFMAQTMVRRNQSLAQAIDSNLTDSNRVFVIGGTNHFILRNEGNVSETDKKAVEILDKYLDRKDYLILVAEGLTERVRQCHQKDVKEEEKYGTVFYYARKFFKPFQKAVLKVASLVKDLFIPSKNPSYIEFIELLGMFRDLATKLSKDDFSTEPLKF